MRFTCMKQCVSNFKAALLIDLAFYARISSELVASVTSYTMRIGGFWRLEYHKKKKKPTTTTKSSASWFWIKHCLLPGRNTLINYPDSKTTVFWENCWYRRYRPVRNSNTIMVSELWSSAWCHLHQHRKLDLLCFWQMCIHVGRFQSWQKSGSLQITVLYERRNSVVCARVCDFLSLFLSFFSTWNFEM